MFKLFRGNPKSIEDRCQNAVRTLLLFNNLKPVGDVENFKLRELVRLKLMEETKVVHEINYMKFFSIRFNLARLKEPYKDRIKNLFENNWFEEAHQIPGAIDDSEMFERLDYYSNVAFVKKDLLAIEYGLGEAFQSSLLMFGSDAVKIAGSQIFAEISGELAEFFREQKIV